MDFETAKLDDTALSVPSLPTGGGAIRGIGETFKANPATGTASMSVPLPFSPARALTPSLALHYDSGSGNGPFGLGWSVPVARIARRTDRQLPTYDDQVDRFALGGAELVPVLEHGAPQVLQGDDGGRDYAIQRFRPRIESGFERIELWRDRADASTHWRVWSAANIVTIYGAQEAARLFDPDAPNRVFGWFIERVFDAKGNLVLYEYDREDDAGVLPGDPVDGPRLGKGQAQVYLRRVLYGNRTPFSGSTPAEEDFCFRTVFDYGETAAFGARSDPESWPLRADPFSTYRAGFEQRTRRLCRRIVTEHLFPDEIGGEPECTASLELSYDTSASGQSRLASVQSAGYTRQDQGDAYEVTKLPPLTFTYSQAAISTKVAKVRGPSGSAAATGTRGAERWTDLLGEGLPGLLAEDGGALTYRRNLGGGVLADAQPLAVQPNLSGLGDAIDVQDRLGRGAKQVLVAAAGIDGQYRADPQTGFAPFHGVATTLTAFAQEANLRAVDLTGDGRLDRLRTDGAHLVWYKAAEDGGFDAAQRVALPVDGKAGPAFVFSDAEGLTFLADMSGDGLLDVVRVDARRVRYWPNLGFGRFGQGVEMAHPPALRSGMLSPEQLRLADLNGNGLTDILLITDQGITVWFNRSGGGFSEALRLDGLFPSGVPANEISVTDLLGQGTACISWTGRQTGLAQGQRVYVDLYGGVKPDLLARIENGFGGLTELSYRPSTAFAREAEEAGRPWVTQLHFPVQCLAATKVTDQVTGYCLTTSYAYHHGFYDPDDREFRGFARVDQYDSEKISDGGGDQPRAFFQPTRLTRTWYHTGARLGHQRLEAALAAEFYASEDLPLDPLLPELPPDLSDHEWAEAQRALKGSMLRSETYALDDAAASAHPYTIAFGQVHLRKLQDAAVLVEPVPPVFQLLSRQNVSITLDRNPSDPRASQSIVLEWNDWGMPLAGVSLAHGRWGEIEPDAPEGLEAQQRTPVVGYSEQRLTQARDPSATPVPGALLGNTSRRFLPVSFESTGFEVRGLHFAPRRLADVDALRAEIQTLPDLPFTDHDTARGRRRLAASRAYFAAGNLEDPLPLGEIGPLGIVHHSRMLAFTQDCLDALYGGRITQTELSAARYVRDSDTDTDWWVPSGTAIHGPAPEERFYLPVGSRDPFDNDSLVEFDSHFLALTRSIDPLGNSARLINDYRRLAPVLVQDANQNWAAVKLNGLGQPVASALMGKVAGDEDPTGHEACEGSTLDRPSTAFDYDLDAWIEGRGPARVTRSVFEAHGSGTEGLRASIQSHDYTDGFGNLLMTKAQQAPGPAQRLSASGELEEIDTGSVEPRRLRWLGNGRTIYNNKGQPLRQFEPYFSVTPDYEDAAALVEQGISIFPFYDAAGRLIGQLNPDGSWTKQRVTPWRIEAWDGADTCLTDPLQDPDLRAHFEGLPPDIHAQTWYAQRIKKPEGDEDRRGAEASAHHAGTPAISFLDAAGRAVHSLLDNAGFGRVAGQTRLDIEGNTLGIVDDLGREVVRYGYNLLPPPDKETPKPALFQHSVDQGFSRSFPDCLGRAFLGWDALGRRSRSTYDALSRPLEVWLQDTDGTERRISLTVYGEGAPEAVARNLRGEVWQGYGSDGFSQTNAIDFMGNPLASERRLLDGNADAPHWPDDPADRAELLEDVTYRSQTDFDAMSRPVRVVLPGVGGAAQTIQYPGYDQGGALSWMEVEAVGGARKRYVENIVYDAKGQRQSVAYGNQVHSRYVYDPQSYRLTRLVTEGPAGPLQDLGYSYDAVGNVIAIRDATQADVHHGNARIEPVSRYTYDALYRLIEATGREHVHQTGAPDWQTGLNASGQINDFQQLRPYTQTYRYDSVGNIETMQHVATGNNWTRHYGYDPANHQLLWTNTGRSDDVGADRYGHNAAGTMTSLPHLGDYTLNASERMVEVDLGGGGRAFYTYDGGGNRVRKRIEQIGAVRQERLYLGGIEIYRKWVGERLVLRRETVHVADDAGVIALIETRTHDENGEIPNPERLERYQLTNHLGSATLEVDGAGQVLTREEYHPYGTTAFFASAPGRALPPKRYRYTGQEKDEETGLQLHGARHYAPWLGRWTAADPIGVGDGTNVYAYVGGRPVGSVDLDGLREYSSIPDLIKPDLPRDFSSTVD